MTSNNFFDHLLDFPSEEISSGLCIQPPTSLSLDMLVNQTFFLNGKEYCLVEKESYICLAEHHLKRALDSDSTEDEDTYQPSKRKKTCRVRNEYHVSDTCVSLIVEGKPSFHTTQDIYFLNMNSSKCVRFKFVKGFLNGVEKDIACGDFSCFSTRMKVGSSKTFNSKSKGIYRMIFELDLEGFSYKQVEWTVDTQWKGYSKSKSFKSLDVLSYIVSLVDSTLNPPPSKVL